MYNAIIDIGTNTFNLLVYERGERLHVHHSEEVAVFLGRGMQSQLLTEEAMDRGMSALSAFVAKARALGAPTAPVPCGTRRMRPSSWNA
jgi:exopolyphosphatase / guanosine-5'-triphosphate,3'-diphosphate pyrophosphatase